MRSFEYYTPTKVIFGKDTHLKIGELLKDYNCHKVLIHYGSESAVKSGLIDDIKKCLTDAGFDFGAGEAFAVAPVVVSVSTAPC